MVAVAWPVELGQDGPTTEFAGGWMSTNLQDWQMIPPSPGNPAFGYELSGPEGETGYFHMFIPQATIDLLSELEGIDLSIDDLAVFEDDEQSSISVSEYDTGVYTGALININVTFTEDATTTETLSTNVTKKLTVAKQEALSITAQKSSLKKNKTAHLFGWLKSGKKGKAITLWRKLNGASKYKKIDTGTTLKDGYYEFDSVVKKTAKYKVKCNHKTSSIKRITIRN
jgi:hypothetical protein